MQIKTWKKPINALNITVRVKLVVDVNRKSTSALRLSAAMRVGLIHSPFEYAPAATADPIVRPPNTTDPRRPN